MRYRNYTVQRTGIQSKQCDMMLHTNKVTRAKSNQGHIMVLQTYTPNNVPTKYQLPTFYGFRDI